MTPILVEPRAVLVRGESAEVLDGFPEASVDAVVTDPPYELGFMGKTWDSSGVAYDPAFWRAVLRVLKPGGHLLAFGGTRTYHRMTCAIEDAGFEIRDSLHWMYGCVPAETEILTERGWLLPGNLVEGEQVVQVDAKGKASLTRLQAVQCFPFAGDLVQVRTRSTLQLLTPNHTVCSREVRVGSRPQREQSESDLVSCTAEDFATADREGVVARRLPLAARGADPRRTLESVDVAALYGWIIAEGHYHADVSAISIYQNEGANADKIAALLARLEIPHSVYRRDRDDYDGTMRPSLQFYLKVGSWCDRIRADMPGKKPTPSEWLAWLPDAEASALFEALVDGDGSRNTETSGAWYQKRPGVRAWFQSLCFRLGYRTTENADKSAISWCKSDTTEVQRGAHRERTVSRVPFSGVVWCPTVAEGRWVARYRGNVFVTGNSGFPKSLDVSKAIDKAAGAARAVVQSLHRAATGRGDQGKGGYAFGEDFDVTAPATPDAVKWSGWGTALKPAHEPIVLARKPLIGTVAVNVLTHGTGALNIDACRIGTAGGGTSCSNRDEHGRCLGHENAGRSTSGETFHGPDTSGGRWPANVLLDESASAELDEQTGVLTSGARSGKRTQPKTKNTFGAFALRDEEPSEASSGGASRFFYTAKPSRRERDFGCDALPMRSGGDATGREDGSAGLSSPRAGAGRGGGARNIHPTVKPVALMRYLCRLITPPGGLVLDPFCGSGSTGVGALAEGFRFVGIDRDTDDATGEPLGYCDIAKARLLRALADTNKED